MCFNANGLEELSAAYTAELSAAYTAVIGRPRVPPLWSLGFEQSRYGYNSTQELQSVVFNYKDNRIPLETMVSDVDYMDAKNPFTVNATAYAPEAMRDFMDDLHDAGQTYVAIVDPAVRLDMDPSTRDGEVYVGGLQAGAFVGDSLSLSVSLSLYTLIIG
ncbi:glycoside hydrolase family 31, partial [Kipferlia bialata]|eukprot:g13225.t1